MSGFKFVIIGCAAAALFFAETKADDSIDPMVWNANQWKSTLFVGKWKSRVRRAYDHRVHETYVLRHVEVIVRNESPPQETHRSRAKLLTVGMREPSGVRHLTPQGHCRGPMVIIWKNGRAHSKCHGQKSR